MTGKPAAINYEAFFKVSYGLYIVSSAGPDGKLNGFVSNAVFQVTAEPPQFAVCCNKNNYTAGLISDSGQLSVSVIKRDASQELISLFGYQSGRDIDKFRSTGHIITPAGTPVVIQDCVAWFECRVNKSLDVGTHMLYTGEIINSEIIDTNGEPLTYSWYREKRKGVSPKNAPTYIAHEEPVREAAAGERYRCVICGHIYDPAEGDPDNGIPAGTSFNDLPGDWRCPICGADKASFDRIN